MKKLFYIICLGGLLLGQVACNNSENQKISEKELELQKRELDLKQRELELKEKELAQQEKSSKKETSIPIATNNSSTKVVATDKSSSGGYNIDKHNDIKVFINDLAKAVSTNDKNAISQMINFPFVDEWGDNPYNESTPLGCRDVRQFFEKFDKIFTNDIKKAIIAKKYRGYSDQNIDGDVINKGEYLIDCLTNSNEKRQCNNFGIKRVNGKFKIYAIKFYS